MAFFLSKIRFSYKISLVFVLVIVCSVFLRAPEANAENCFQSLPRPVIGNSDVFWGNPPSPYQDITQGPGTVVRMSFEGTFPGDDPIAGPDCEGATITAQIAPDGNPSAVSATVSGNLVSGSQILPGNFGSWQWYVDWPHNLFDGRYRMEIVAVNGFALNGDLSSNVLTIVGAGPPPIPLTCGLVANPSSGAPPLNGVDMTVSITSPWDGTAHEYGIDCNNDGTYEGTEYLTTNPYTFVDACNYPSAGTYNPRGHLRNLGTQQQADCSLGIVTLYPPVNADILCNGSDACSIAYNGSGNLSWSSTNATSCTVTPGGGTGTNGTQSTGNLTATATYNLTCVGTGGSATDSVTVTVGAPPPPTADIQCNGGNACSIGYNTAATITWSSTNASSCTVAPTGWTGVPTGSQSTGSLTATTTYNLSCTGNAGTQTDTVVVTVGSPPPPPVPTAQITCGGVTGQCSVAYGGTATINWTCTNATSGSVTNSIDALVLPGLTGPYTTVPLSSTLAYSLVCTGPGGSANSSVVVNVGSPPPPPPPPPEPAATSFTLYIRNPFSGGINTIEDLFNAAVTFLYFVAGPIVVIMIILSGLFFLFARDQADKINTAKKILTYALVGFAIILIGRGFIALINSILALGT